MPKKRRHTAIMFTDIVGYTSLMGSDEDLAFEVLKKNREIHTRCIQEFNGTLIKEMGDGMLISFDLASEAVRFAMEIQKTSKEQGIPLKIGIHEGEMVFEDHDVLGDGVNVASRIQEAAEEGCIMISSTVYHDVKNQKCIRLKYAGKQHYKNVEEAIEVYKVCISENDTVDQLASFESVYSNSIAVLPFINTSSDLEQEYFCDGLSEEILNVLSQFKSLKVASRTSAFSWKGKKVDIREIGAELEVNTVLEGSVRKMGNRIRISVQLINVHDGYQLWSERYDRLLDDIFDIQEDISIAVVDALKIALFKEERNKIKNSSTVDKQAYEFYLKGKYHRNKLIPSSLFKSIEYFQQSILIEPNYADAYAGQAVSYFYLLIYHILPPSECVPKLTETSLKACKLDHRIAEGHLAYGMLNFYHKWDFVEAENAYRKALELNPNHGEAHAAFGIILALVGKKGEARRHAIKALEVDPFSVPTNYYVAWTYFLTEDFDLMAGVSEKMIELEPPFLGHAMVGFKYWLEERMHEAEYEFEKASASRMPMIFAWLGCVSGILGNQEKANCIIQKLWEMGKQQYVGAYNIGLVNLGLGRADEAFKWFDTGCNEQRDGVLLFLKQKFKVLPGLTKDSRMDELIKRFGLPEDVNA